MYRNYIQSLVSFFLFFFVFRRHIFYMERKIIQCLVPFFSFFSDIFWPFRTCLRPMSCPLCFLTLTRYICDECVFAGQNVFQGPAIHLPRLDCYVKSHHLHMIHLVYWYCCFQMRFQKRH